MKRGNYKLVINIAYKNEKYPVYSFHIATIDRNEILYLSDMQFLCLHDVLEEGEKILSQFMTGTFNRSNPEYIPF